MKVTRPKKTFNAHQFKEHRKKIPKADRERSLGIFAARTVILQDIDDRLVELCPVANRSVMLDQLNRRDQHEKGIDRYNYLKKLGRGF